MALTSSTIWEVQTGGDDTNNGGAFDPSQTAGMFTDGASTSSTSATPNFSSASYSFVSNDVGAWIYIASGTNWIPGWYKITAISGSAATLNAAIGAAVLKTTLVPSTVQGVGATTGATWTIDYSQGANSGAGPAFTYLDLLSAGTGLTVSSALKPFGKQQVGNSIVITGGTNFNTGRYVIASVGVGPTFIATVVGPTNITTGAGVNGVGSQGGVLLSIGLVGSVALAGNHVHVKTGSYSITSASNNVSGGCFAPSGSNILLQGYGTVRGDMGTPATFTASGISTAILITMAVSGNWLVANLILDGASLTSIKGISSDRGSIYKVQANNCTNGGFSESGRTIHVKCSATGCSTVTAFSVSVAFGCEAFSNSITGFTASAANTSFIDCISYANTGSTTDGFSTGQSATLFANCIAYNNGRDGFRSNGSGTSAINCISEGNVAGSANGYNFTGGGTRAINCGAYNNTTNFTITPTFGATQIQNLGSITATSTFFVNAAGGNFALNNVSTGGALARSASILGTFPAGTSIGYLDIGAVQARWPMVPMNIMKVG